MFFCRIAFIFNVLGHNDNCILIFGVFWCILTYNKTPWIHPINGFNTNVPELLLQLLIKTVVIIRFFGVLFIIAKSARCPIPPLQTVEIYRSKQAFDSLRNGITSPEHFNPHDNTPWIRPLSLNGFNTWNIDERESVDAILSLSWLVHRLFVNL